MRRQEARRQEAWRQGPRRHDVRRMERMIQEATRQETRRREDRTAGRQESWCHEKTGSEEREYDMRHDVKSQGGKDTPCK